MREVRRLLLLLPASSAAAGAAASALMSPSFSSTTAASPSTSPVMRASSAVSRLSRDGTPTDDARAYPDDSFVHIERSRSHTASVRSGFVRSASRRPKQPCSPNRCAFIGAPDRTSFIRRRESRRLVVSCEDCTSFKRAEEPPAAGSREARRRGRMSEGDEEEAGLFGCGSGGGGGSISPSACGVATAAGCCGSQGMASPSQGPASFSAGP